MTSRISILPQDVLDSLIFRLNVGLEGREAPRFLRLPHPRTGVPSLFLPYRAHDSERTKILEVQVVAPPNERSWIMTEGQILEDGQLLLMTPVDPAFLLIPILRSIHPSDGSLGNFRPLEDMLEDASRIFMRRHQSERATAKGDNDVQLTMKDITEFCAFDCVLSAAKRICETKDITEDIVVYRYSPERVVKYLKNKVSRVANPTLLDGSRTIVRSLAKDGLMEDGKESLLESGRLRAACDLISHYTPPDIFDSLLASYDFAALNAHLEAAQQETAALAASKMANVEAKESKGSKDTTDAAKKRKAAAKGSHGVEQLKKVNVKGMAKLSTFFQKAA
ncbi:hypothetical protein K474DRAFT_1635966 [Panus rudis PR-1116 ss-1]|nr:hypothetical protein K474DRAFT_1635966 [Panus rudis PR-1116 ss-1]